MDVNEDLPRLQVGNGDISLKHQRRRRRRIARGVGLLTLGRLDPHGEHHDVGFLYLHLIRSSLVSDFPSPHLFTNNHPIETLHPVSM